jgi:hypothetical protein
LDAVVLAPHILLRLRREQRQMPIVGAHDGEDPAGGAAHRAHLGHRLVEGAGIELETAMALGLHRPKQARFLEIGEGFVGQPAQLLGPRRPLADRRQQIPHTAEEFVRCHGGPIHWALLVV